MPRFTRGGNKGGRFADPRGHHSAASRQVERELYAACCLRYRLHRAFCASEIRHAWKGLALLHERGLSTKFSVIAPCPRRSPRTFSKQDSTGARSPVTSMLAPAALGGTNHPRPRSRSG